MAPSLLLLLVLSFFVGAAADCGSGAVGDPNLCISTVAGKLITTDDQAVLYPTGVAELPVGLVVFISPGRLRAATKDGAVVDLAGGKGSPSSSIATEAPVGDSTGGIRVDGEGNIFFADSANSIIRKVYRNNTIATVAGLFNMPGFNGDGQLAVSAMLYFPDDVALAGNGDLVIADSFNYAIRRVSARSGVITTVSGSPEGYVERASGDGGSAVNAEIGQPTAVAVAPNGDIIFFAYTSYENIMWRIDSSTGIINAISGGSFDTLQQSTDYRYTGAAINAPLYTVRGIALHPVTSDVFFSDGISIVCIRSAAGTIDSVFSQDNISSVFNPFVHKFASNGDLLVSNWGDNSLLRINLGDLGFRVVASATRTNDTSSNTALVAAVNATTFVGPRGVAVTASNDLLIADRDVPGSAKVYCISAATGAIALVAGSGTAVSIFDAANDIVVTPSGSVILAGDSVVARLNLSTGAADVIAGKMGSLGSTGDGGPATNATLGYVNGVAVDPSGEYIFVTDTGNHCIRRINLTSGIIDSIAGTIGVAGATGDGSAAINATLNSPRAVAVAPSGDYLVIADARNFCVRLLNLTTGIISTVAGKIGIDLPFYLTSTGFGDGGAATNALFIRPTGVAVGFDGALFISDTYMGWGAVRRVDAVTGIISTIAGMLEKNSAGGDGGPATSAFLRSPFKIALGPGPDGSLFIADRDTKNIREVPLFSSPVCPPGFFCSIGRNLAPCTISSTYCPANVRAPLRIPDGFYAIGSPSPFDPKATIYASVGFCPVGFFCPPSTGARLPCFSGSFGVTELATAPSQCAACGPTVYLAEAGNVTASTLANPCLSCPDGSISPLPGGRFCDLCAPGFLGANNRCTECPRNAFSLYGVSSCFALNARDSFASSFGAVSFQRLIDVESGNWDASDVFQTTLQFSLPTIFFAVLPILLITATGLFCPLAATHFMSSVLEKIDLYRVKTPLKRGGSPFLDPSALGGALSFLSVGAVLALMISTSLQFAYVNVLLQKSALPATLPAMASFASLPLKPVATIVSAGINDPALLELVEPSRAGTGFVVTVATMGSRCGALRGSISADLYKSNFSVTSHFNATTGAARHTFYCPDCFVNGLSRLNLALDASCQSLLITIVAAGVGGGFSSSSIYSTNSAAPGQPLPASVFVSFPLVFEVIQDGVAGAPPRSSDSLITGGRSAAGYIALAALDKPTVVFGATAADTGTVNITIALPLQASYTLYQLSPILSYILLFSSLTAWLGLLGAGRVVMYLVDQGKALKLKLSNGDDTMTGLPMSQKSTGASTTAPSSAIASSSADGKGETITEDVLSPPPRHAVVVPWSFTPFKAAAHSISRSEAADDDGDKDEVLTANPLRTNLPRFTLPSTAMRPTSET